MKTTCTSVVISSAMSLCLAACSRSSPAVPAPLVEGQHLLQNISAYQVKSVTRNLQSHYETTSETEIERGILHHREVSSGKVQVDLITDGKQEFLPDDQGQYEEAHGDAAATLKEQIGLASLKTILVQAGSIQFTQHDQVNGAAASVYTLRSGFGTSIPEVVRVWLADTDHRPLKVEEELRWATAQHQEGTAMQVASTVYSYNPDIRVQLPRK